MAKPMKMTLGRTAAGRFPGGSQWPTILLLLIALIFAALALLSYLKLSDLDASNSRQSLAAATRGTQIQQLVRSAREAVRGDSDAFERMRRERDQLKASLSPSLSALVGAGGPGADQARQAEQAWTAMNGGVEQILAEKDPLLALREHIKIIETLLPQVRDAMTMAANRLVSEGASPAQALQAGLQSARLERMGAALERFMNVDASQAIEDFSTASNEFAATLNDLAEQANTRPASDTGARAALAETTRLFAGLHARAGDMLRLMEEAQPVIKLPPTLETAGLQLEAALDKLMSNDGVAQRQFTLAGIPIGVGAVLLFGALRCSASRC